MGFQPDISDDFFQTFQITSNFLNQTHFFTKDGLPVPWPALAAFSTKRPGMNIDEMKGSMGAGPGVVLERGGASCHWLPSINESTCKSPESFFKSNPGLS